MNDKEYNELEGLRRSDLWHINKTPKHFIYNLNNPTEKTEALTFGSAIHKYILEPRTFEDEYATLPSNIDRRTKQGKLDYAVFLQANEGKEIITLDTFKQIVDMANALLNDPIVKDLLINDTQKEQVYTWIDPETKEKVKAKVDAIKNNDKRSIIVDYKTTTSCEDMAFERACIRYGYDFQAGMYTEIVEGNTMASHDFVFIAQEKTPPYLHRVYFCAKEFIEQGKTKYYNLLRLYHRCKLEDTWPGYEPVDLLEEYY